MNGLLLLKDQWWSCGCCTALCPAPTVKVEYKHYSSGVCGHIKKLPPNDDVVLPVTVWRDRIDLETYNDSWVDNGKSFTKNYSFELLNHTKEILAQNCSYEYIFTGSGTTTQDYTFIEYGVQKFEGCGPAPSVHDLTLTHSTTWTYTINNNDPQKVDHVFNRDIQRPLYEDFECQNPTRTLNKWGGDYSYENTNVSQELVVNQFRTFKYKADLYGADNQSAATEVRSFASPITWAVVEAAIDMEAVNYIATESTAEAYAEFAKTGITHDGVLYPEAPSSLIKHEARFRFKVSPFHEGSYFAIKYQFVIIPSDGSPEIEQVETDLIWSGPGNQNNHDDDDWFTSWVTIPEDPLGKVQLRLLKYRCTSKSSWTRF